MLEIADRRAPDVAAHPWLERAAAASRFAFYGGPAARAALAPLWGASFSEQACRAGIADGRATLWLGPDEYLLLDSAPREPAAATLAALESALTSVPHALVDVSHRQFGLRVRGPEALHILSGACPLDLDASQFPVGMCTRTVLAKADIVLWRTGATEFHLEVWRSFAAYVTGVLGEIANEFLPPA